MYLLWDSKTEFPQYEEMREIKNIDHINVHTAVKGEYQFLLGAAIIKHKNVWYASWGNSFRNENDDNTILAEKRSFDNGKTWTNYGKISETNKGFGRSHGVYFEHKGKLYAFCPKAGFDKVDAYPDLKMEGYLLGEQGNWECLGIVLEDDFWPMCEPIVLDDGTILMAGLKTDTTEAAIALCDGKDITKWEMKVLPNPENYKYWGETTVLKKRDKLVAISRSECDWKTYMSPYALVSESYDGGQTWTGLEESNFLISQSKMFAGTLSNGNNYVVFSTKGKEKHRDTLCIAIGKESFDKIYVIRHGFEGPPKFWPANEWSYPYAYEDVDNKKLYVVYAKNKEDCELAIIPLESIT